MTTTISVVVPTRDRPEQLGRCLDALASQRGAELQILVVDDGSADGTSVPTVVASRSGVTLLRTGRSGPVAARNAGVAASTGDVVLFLDDDCVPEPEWAARLCGAVIANGVDVVGGTTSFDAHRPLVAASETVVRYAEDRLGFVTTRNAGCLRAFASAHPFDEGYPEAAGEDRAWCATIRGLGGSLAREPGAIVHHDVHLDAVRFLRQHARYGRAARRLARAGIPETPASLRFRRGLVLEGFRGGPRVGLLVLVSQLATLAGYLRAPRR